MLIRLKLLIIYVAIVYVVIQYVLLIYICLLANRKVARFFSYSTALSNVGLCYHFIFSLFLSQLSYNSFETPLSNKDLNQTINLFLKNPNKSINTVYNHSINY